jgi:type 1 glutamine amidotransferase
MEKINVILKLGKDGYGVWFKITSIIIISFLMLLAGSCQKKTNPVRVLLITGGHDFDKEPFYSFVNSLQGITVSEVKHPDALAMFRPENRSSYDVVLLYDMPDTISEQKKKDFIDCLNEGKGLIVWHHAYCSYQNWKEYQNIVGGRYHQNAWTDDGGISHPASTYQHDVQLHVKVADKNHPVTKDINDFDILDEIYGGGSVNSDVHVLLTTDNPSSTPALVWTNLYGKSKVVTILLGHDNHAWSNPDFKKLLTQAILWAK